MLAARSSSEIRGALVQDFANVNEFFCKLPKRGCREAAQNPIPIIIDIIQIIGIIEIRKGE